MTVWKNVCSKKYHSENCPLAQCLLGELPVQLTVFWRTVPRGTVHQGNVFGEPSIGDKSIGEMSIGEMSVGELS